MSLLKKGTLKTKDGIINYPNYPKSYSCTKTRFTRVEILLIIS